MTAGLAIGEMVRRYLGMRNAKKRRLDVQLLESRRLLTGVASPVISLEESSTFEFFPTSDTQVTNGLVVDLNGDGLDDYVISTGNRRVEFWLQEDGKHQRFGAERVSSEISEIAAADINGDGLPDLLVATSRRIEVFINAGEAAAESAEWGGVIDGETVSAAATSLLLEDLNGDGFKDLVVGGASQLEVRAGTGDGRFGDGVGYAVGSGQYSLASADLNGDGHVDLVVGAADRQNGTVEVLANDGSGAFESTHQVVDPGPVRTLQLADMNADGNIDLLVGTWVSRELDHGGENIHVWMGDGMGAFAGTHDNYETAGSPIDMSVTDINLDGLNDLVVGHDSTFHHPITNNGPGGVSVLLGGGDGRLHQAVRISTPGAFDVHTNGQSIVSFQQWGNTVATFSWADDSFVESATEYAQPVDNPFTNRTAVVGDFNADGISDVAVATIFRPDPTLTVYLANADGGYNLQDIPLSSNATVNDLHVGDFNGDGSDDLSIRMTVSGRHQLGTILADGAGGFESLMASSVSQSLRLFEVVDVDGDGRDDRVGSLTSSIVVYGSLEDGSFDQIDRTRLSGASNVSNLTVAESNPDGSANLLVISNVGVHALAWDGENGFVEDAETVTSHYHTFGDFNGDGHLDTAFGSYSENSLRVVWGEPGGGLSRPQIAASRENVQSLRSADANGDGADELIVVYQETFEFLDGSSGEFESLGETYLGGTLGSIVTTDVTGDGVQDLLVAEGGNFISSSPSTKIVLMEGVADGVPATSETFVIPGIDGALLSATSSGGSTELLITHRYGFSSVVGRVGDADLPGDFNLDGSVDAADIDLLCVALHTPDADLGTYDVNADGELNTVDSDYWIREIAETRRGDLDLDGDVDFEDFLELSGNFGSAEAGWAAGDLDCDGEVGFEDFLAMAANFGFGEDA